jgi:hypothetical protein
MLRAILGILSLATLAACLVLPVLHFRGSLDNESYKHYFLIASAAWFVFAIPWAAQGKPKRPH